MTMKLNIKKLDVKTDSRGWLAEIWRPEDVGGVPFGQLLVTTAHPGQTKGKHYHKRKREWYCVVAGRGKLTVTDRKTQETVEFEMGERNMVSVEIPVGSFHSITNIGHDKMYLLAYTDESFNPSDPDVYYET